MGGGSADVIAVDCALEVGEIHEDAAENDECEKKDEREHDSVSPW